VQGTKITKSYIGSCTGGKLEDFRMAAKILKGKSVVVPTNIVPATVKVMRDLECEQYQGESLKQIFENAGCSIALPSCAACLGGPADTVGRSVDNDIVVSTTNRNFPGRMGSKHAGVYLASPLTAAASAVTGKLTDPRDFL
ncbi:MAG: 3-isopropylmalate dehydratase, partial [Chlorobiaceae bacterium]|nr:3-isopropylmalate dehydratase [Chlorobiaceae bacterium]